MQDHQTDNDDTDTLDDEGISQYEDLVRAFCKKIVAFVCFGPGVLGVMWIIGRLFKR